LIAQFEQERTRLRAIAHRMLGSFAEADDALQDAWLRVERADTSGIDNPAAWLTTVVGRVCLNMLRDRREHAFEMPDPVVETGEEPEQRAVAKDQVGLAMLIVLDSLKPDERLAFVLHDMFAVPFDDIAPLIDKTPAAARQLASRARKRVQDRPRPNVDLPKQREVVQAFLKASQEGDLEGLVAEGRGPREHVPQVRHDGRCRVRGHRRRVRLRHAGGRRAVLDHGVHGARRSDRRDPRDPGPKADRRSCSVSNTTAVTGHGERPPGVRWRWALE
jgi:RNA polymerase sigma factor (sigma-70 family)